MRRFHLLFGALTCFVVAVPGFAETPTEDSDAAASADSMAAEEMPPAASEASDELAWEQFDDPEFDPSAPTDEAQPDAAPMVMDTDAAGSAAEMAVSDDTMSPTDASAGSPEDGSIMADVELTSANEFEMSQGVVLGPQGIDDQGRSGRLHTVSKGDTLWDLAAAYLGTAWVWPSVWIDNDDIDNPHLIVPGDRMWITANEMRVVNDAEAESFLTPSPAPVPVEDELAGSDPIVIEETDGFDAMPTTEEVQPLAALEAEDASTLEVEDASTLEAFPVAVVGQESAEMDSGRRVTVSRRDAMGFVSADDMAGSSTVVDSSVERTFLAAGDSVVLGMGEGDVEVGDQFTIFQTIEEVRDVESNRVLGHHVDILGWLEVKELTGDTALAEIRESFSLVKRGARVMARPTVPRSVMARSTPDAIEGKIVFLPAERAVMADGGYVYLNRGEFHGVEVGSELEVFDSGTIVNDRSRRVDVRTPDHRVARLVVVTVTAESSVAFVLTSSRELMVGDDVRPRADRLAQR